MRLYEPGERLCGQVLSILEVASRSGYESIIRYLTGELDRRGVHVELSRRMSAETILAEGSDAVIVATGDRPLRTGVSADLRTSEKCQVSIRSTC